MPNRTTLIAAALAIACAFAQAATLRVANQGDALSMDPHSLNESLQLSFTGNIYEPLVARGKQLELVPGLATKWTLVSPTVWRFDLRKGVTFHDGTPFTADDVLFTFKRAAADGSDMRSYTAPIKDVRKIDDTTVEIETLAPFPILPDTLTTLYMMSKKWSEDNKATVPVDRRKGIENTASFKANGTGPYRLKERQPGSKTVLVANPRYWGKVDGNVDEVIFTPIGNDATRVAALLSGETALADNHWHMISIVVDQSAKLWHMYLDGVEYSYAPPLDLNNLKGPLWDSVNDYPFTIWEDGTGHYNANDDTRKNLAGFVDDFRIYTKALSTVEVSGIYVADQK